MNIASDQRESLPRGTSLSEVLRQQLITSPLLDWKNKKSPSTKNQEKSKVLNENLFGFENSTKKKRRGVKKAEVDLSTAVRENLVRIKVKPDDHDVKKLIKETEYLRKANHRTGGAFPTKVDEVYQKSIEPEGTDVPTKVSGSSGVKSKEEKLSIKSNSPSLKLITFNTWSKEHSIFGTHYTNLLKSSEASRGSRSRFGSMQQFNGHPITPRSSENSGRVVGVSSSARCRKSTRLDRQYSAIHLAQSTISMSMASLKTVGTTNGSLPDESTGKSSLGRGVSDCAFPGFEPGQHCHSVAATILQRKNRGYKLSSSSSSDDLFQSTRYAREILEEKFRGIKLDMTEHETEETAPAKDAKSKRETPKVTKNHKCKCTATHGNCARGASNWSAVVRQIFSDSRESARDQLEVTPYQVSKKRSKMRNVDESHSQVDKIGQNLGKVDKSQDKIQGNLVVSNELNDLSRHSFERPPPCNKGTCPSRIEGATNGDVKRRSMNSEFGPSVGPYNEEATCSKGCSKRTTLNTTASAASLKLEVPDEDPCTSQTCLFSKSKESFAKKRKQRDHSGAHSHRARYHRKSKKAICSYKTCKVPFRYPKNRFMRPKRSTSGSSGDSSKSHSTKSRFSSKQKRDRPHICKCQHLYTGEKESLESDDIWVDADIRRARNRRYKLNFEVLEQKKKAKCGGFSTGAADCSCYVCKVKVKPWAKYLKQRKTLIDIPYLLTPKTLNERANKTGEMRKTLGEAFQWSEEDLKNFCTKYYSCKTPDTRKALLKDNPYLMNVCDKNPKSTKAKPVETGIEEQGRFGYFVDVLDDRLAMDETYGNLQAFAERAVYCKWHQDTADMKVSHFLENMPKQQSCYSEPTHFDPDRRTCYNPRLIERLADMVQFNMKPDRKIHEFSFPPKLLKYQEPQLVGDTRMDMPEIEILKEPGHLPTIYRDIFKTNKHELRKLMDTLLPPLQWTDNIGFWEMKVSLEPDNVETNRKMISYLEENETLCHAINKKFCAGRYRLHFEVFAEIIRQELLEYPERASLLSRIREEFLLTMLLYDGGLEMTLTSTTHLWKSVEAESEAEKSREVEFLEEDISELKSEISDITALTYELEKRAEELADSRGYLREDEVKLYKKTIHQLNAQFESIKAGFLYELD